MPVEATPSGNRWHNSDSVRDRENTWQVRVLLASFPTSFGPVVRAVLGRNTKTGVALALKATIGVDAVVRADMRKPLQRGGYGIIRMQPIGHVRAVRDEFRRLADHCKLSDNERRAMFDDVKKWAGRDERAINGVDIPDEKRVI